MNNSDLQIAFLTARLNRKYFDKIIPKMSEGTFFSYEQLGDEWERRLHTSKSKYLLVFIEDIMLKYPGQEHLPLKPCFIPRLVRDRRLGHVIFSLDSEGFSALSRQNDKEICAQCFIRYWQIMPSSNSLDYVDELESIYRSEFMIWLEEHPC